MKTYLKSSYPSLSEDGKLLVVVPDGLPFDYLRQDVHRQELGRILSEYAGGTPCFREGMTRAHF